ncbi:MAG: DUF4350 domain-containing protein [bacterium]
MKKSSQIAGLCGFLLLLFGVAEFLFTRQFSLYTGIHLGGGAVLVVFSLIFNLGGVWSTLGERSTRYGANAVLYTAVFLAILGLLNFVSNAHSWRKDLTEGGVFSLSDQSQKILENLKEDVEVLAFFEMAKGSKLEDLLKNYGNASKRFRYEFIDPVKHPEKAKQYEITQSEILVVKSGDRTNKITGTAEEDITNAILKVSKQEQKKIYFLAGHGEPALNNQEQNGYEIVRKALENENYQVSELKLFMQENVPQDCTVLVLAGSQKSLEPSELDAIQRYLDQGGNALFLLDPGGSPGIAPFLAKWGVKVGDDAVVDQVFRLFQGPSLGVDPIVEEFGSHEIVKDFQGQVIFHLVRSVQPENDIPQGVNVVSLAKTSPKSWAETDLASLFQKGEVAHTADDLSGPVSVAVALTAERQGSEQGEGEEGKEAKIVVFGDSDFVGNRNIGNMYNADLFLNTVNWLAGEEEFISIRPKATRGSRVAMTPQQTRDIFYFSVLILPEALLLFGLAIWWRRR